MKCLQVYGVFCDECALDICKQSLWIAMYSPAVKPRGDELCWRCDKPLPEQK